MINQENLHSQKRIDRWPVLLFCFGVPTAVIAIALHVIYPWLVTEGLTQFDALVVTTTVPMALLIVAAVGVYQAEGNPMSWRAFRERLRLNPFRWHYLLWGMGIFLVAGFLGSLLQGASLFLIEQGWVSVPDYAPILYDPTQDLTRSAAWEQFVGGRLVGQWRLVVLYFILWIFNVVGEELWWRGIILPHQETRHRGAAWLVHGGLWWTFHLFKWWDMLLILPICLALPWVAQRTKSMWPGLIAHAIANATPLIFLILGAAGIFG